MTDDGILFLLVGVIVNTVVPIVVLIIIIVKKRREIIIKPTLNQVKIIREHTQFFQKFPRTIKRKFLKRLAIFIEYHDFEGREGLEITDLMKVLIAASAVHLTISLKDYLLDLFPKILVYPDVYYSKLTKSYNRGETNPHGIIAVSWNYVEEGFESSEDKINLGYHEFAHALLLQHTSLGLNDLQFSFAYEDFNRMLKQDKLAQKVFESNFLRDYAFINKMEFFAVSAENFLESPEMLKKNVPELYEIMKRLLRQDPAYGIYDLSFYYTDTDFY